MSAILVTSAALAILVDAAVKGTIMLLLAFLLARTLRRVSAGARHLLWTSTLLGLLAVPAISWTAPSWQLPAVSPAGLALEAFRDHESILAEVETAAQSGPAPTGAEVPHAPIGSVLVASRGATFPSALPVDEAPTRTLPQPAVVPVGAWLVLLWLGGVLLSTAWIIGGWWSVARLARNCRRIDDGSIYALLVLVSARLGIRRPIRLLLSNRRAIPMTWGLRHPVVLLPVDAQNWSMDRLRMVLVHELGHVQRWDCLVQMVGLLVRGLYWFHPLAWWAVRELRMEQEQACDDLVLQSGASGPDYAEHLLTVTSGLSGNLWTAPVAFGMGRSEKLYRRLESLLDDGRNHQPVCRRKLLVAALLALALVLPLSTAGWSPAGAAQDAAQDKDKTQQPPAAKDSLLAKKIIEVQEQLVKHYIVPVDEKALADHALTGMLKALNDPYTAYLSKEELAGIENELKGALTGIGTQLGMVDEHLTVATPLEGSPAHKAGVRPGDRIEAIDGKSTQGITVMDAVRRIIGPAGSSVKLKIAHADGVLEEISVTRAEIRFSAINGFRRGADGKWQYLLDGDHKIGYLRANQFSSRIAAEMRETIEALQKDGMKGLILDLRYSPGGLLEQAIEVCKLFLDKGVILTTRGPGKEEKSWKADGKEALGDFPLLVLVNDQTASAAEIVAGSLRDNGRAVLLGTRTFGKGSVQMIMKLDEGGALKMTTANHYLPSGRNIQKRPGEKTWGVDPSDGFYIPLTASQTAAMNKDAQKRGVVGFTKEELPALGRLTPKVIEENHADPQLAAALRTMVARITGGEFIKVGKDQALLTDHAQRLEEMRQRREQLQQSMQQLDRDITDLQQAAGKSGGN